MRSIIFTLSTLILLAACNSPYALDNKLANTPMNLENRGNTCWINVTVQALAHTQTVHELLTAIAQQQVPINQPTTPTQRAAFTLVHALDQLLQKTKHPDLTTPALWDDQFMQTLHAYARCKPAPLLNHVPQEFELFLQQGGNPIDSWNLLVSALFLVTPATRTRLGTCPFTHGLNNDQQTLAVTTWLKNVYQQVSQRPNIIAIPCNLPNSTTQELYPRSFTLDGQTYLLRSLICRGNSDEYDDDHALVYCYATPHDWCIDNTDQILTPTSVYPDFASIEHKLRHGACGQITYHNLICENLQHKTDTLLTPQIGIYERENPCN